jgi:hypothetical protein
MRQFINLIEAFNGKLFSVQNNQAFIRWFAGSKVVDAYGNPLPCFHGTSTEFGDDYHPLSHFGTLTAAEHRLGVYTSDASYFEYNATIRPVYLRIVHPFEFVDNGESNSYIDILDAMYNQHMISRDTFRKYFAELGIEHDEDDTANPIPEIIKLIITTLERNGYDGLRYTNAAEDIGSISWIIFHHSQVRSALKIHENTY